ncbi:ATP-binding cassette domain-containing protein [Synechococcales cyanobacterium C]|uniref:ATP-binding cassette domain-containing protein n=1 Tax=Petrachloros mirabilis ULC683 TaxID=2781853 RepID=A0A8K2A9M7_9CYAN|nr:ATP-binding cassette domain-containing protein [Petrachloros mirabilis ULC683]
MPSIWQYLWQMIRYAQRLYWLDTFLWLVITGFPIVPGLLIREFFDSLTQSPEGGTPWLWIGLLLAAGAGRVIAIFVGRITKTQHRFLMSALVRHNLLLGLLQRPGAELATGGINGHATSPGELLSYFREDAEQLEDTVVGTNEILAEAVFAGVSVALMLSVNATITLLVFVPLCAITALVRRAEQRLKRYRHASRQATQQVTGLLGDLFTAVQAIKVAGAETPMLAELKVRCDRRRRQVVRDQVFTALLNAGFDNIVSLGTGLVLLLAASKLGAQGQLTVGEFALFIYYLSFVTYFLGFLGGFLAQTQQCSVSVARMTSLIGTEAAQPGTSPASVPPTSQPSCLTTPYPLYLKPILGSPPPLPKPAGFPPSEPLQELRVEGLTYHYPGSDNGITNISLTLGRGSLTVITGRVGAGKTTLLRVLLGLLPSQAGAIFWNNQPVTDPANQLIPPRVAYTPQVPQFFSTTLRENLLLGLAGSDIPKRLQGAITTAVFDQDVARLPEGLDTRIGTQGVRLSGGQKQRAAAARMLVRQPELLVFDDLSSALDVNTEQRLWERLLGQESASESDQAAAPSTHRLDHPPTCLIVSHRPVVLSQADQVLVLEAGQLLTASSPR